MVKKIPWNVKDSAFYVLVLFLLGLVFYPQSVLARDPFPNPNFRNKYIQTPMLETNVYPQTMKQSNGSRGNLISFSCYFSGTNKYYFLNDTDIDTLAEATTACNQRHPGYNEVRKPFLKNNINIASGEVKYAINGYDYPIGEFFGNLSPITTGWDWVTPLPYWSYYGQFNSFPCTNNICSPHCQFQPLGSSGDWVKILNTRYTPTAECVAPPYTTSGNWWNDWKNHVGLQNITDANKVNILNLHLGFDGEGRPFKSAWGWDTVAPGFTNASWNFYNIYMQAVFDYVKSQYSTKKLRAHFPDGKLDAIGFLLGNGVDFHWESLGSDESQAYWYGMYNPYGWHQLFANQFWVTNTLGLGTAWPPYYFSVLSALSKHTDGITGIIDPRWGTNAQDDTGNFIKFIGRYIGKDINSTPGVFTALRETKYNKGTSENQGFSGKYGDYDFYLYRPEDLTGNNTEPVTFQTLFNMNNAINNQLYTLQMNNTNTHFVARKNKTGNNFMSFDIDDGFRYANRIPSDDFSFNIRIVYIDNGTTPFYLEYKDKDDHLKQISIPRSGSNIWKEYTAHITDGYFNNNFSDINYPTDFRLNTNNTTIYIHLVEVLPEGTISGENSRPKAQVTCQILRNETDNQDEGPYSVKRNENLKVIAYITNNSGNPLNNERVMFTYNTEWNFAKSIMSSGDGKAVYTLPTTNDDRRSGFLGAGGGRGKSPPWYSVQVYYPGNRNYQPSRNDCLLLITNSSGQTDPENTKIKITAGPSLDSNNKLMISYQIVRPNASNEIVDTKNNVEINQSKAYYKNDTNAQTISFAYTGQYHASFLNINLNTPPVNTTPVPTSTPSPSNTPSPTLSPTPNPTATPTVVPIPLNKGSNAIKFPSSRLSPTNRIATNSLPCKSITYKQNGRFRPFVLNYKVGEIAHNTIKYYLLCSTIATW